MENVLFVLTSPHTGRTIMSFVCVFRNNCIWHVTWLVSHPFVCYKHKTMWLWQVLVSWCTWCVTGSSWKWSLDRDTDHHNLVSILCEHIHYTCDTWVAFGYVVGGRGGCSCLMSLPVGLNETSVEHSGSSLMINPDQKWPGHICGMFVFGWDWVTVWFSWVWVWSSLLWVGCSI